LFCSVFQNASNKPDFHHSMPPQEANHFFSEFVERVKSLHTDPSKVKAGVFGGYMDVALHNDGPVTINLDSKLMMGTPATKKDSGGSSKRGEKSSKSAKPAALPATPTSKNEVENSSPPTSTTSSAPPQPPSGWEMKITKCLVLPSRTCLLKTIVFACMYVGVC
jgi:hypothetical protein